MKMNKILKNIVFTIGMGIFAGTHVDVAVAMKKNKVLNSFNLSGTNKYSSSKIKEKNSQFLLNGKKNKREELPATLKKKAMESKGDVRSEDDSNSHSIDSVNSNPLSIDSADSGLYKKSSISDDADELTKMISEVKSKVSDAEEALTAEKNAKRKNKGSLTGPLGREKALRVDIEKRTDAKNGAAKTNQLLISIDDVSVKMTNLIDRVKSLDDNLSEKERKVQKQFGELKKIEELSQQHSNKLKELEQRKYITEKDLNDKIAIQLAENNVCKNEIDSRLKSFEEKLEALEKKCEGLGEVAFNDVEGQEADLETMGSLLEENRELKEKVEKLESQNTEYEERLKNLGEKLENQQLSYEERFKSLEEQIKTLNPFLRKDGQNDLNDSIDDRSGYFSVGAESMASSAFTEELKLNQAGVASKEEFHRTVTEMYDNEIKLNNKIKILKATLKNIKSSYKTGFQLLNQRIGQLEKRNSGTK